MWEVFSSIENIQTQVKFALKVSKSFYRRESVTAWNGHFSFALYSRTRCSLKRFASRSHTVFQGEQMTVNILKRATVGPPAKRIA